MDQRLVDWLSGHHGVVSREWLEDSRCTPAQIRGLLSSGQLLRAYRGVYVAAATPATLEQRLVGLVLVSGGVVSHATAGQLWGFRKLNRFQDHHLSIRHRRRVDIAGVVVHATTALTPADVVQQDDGIHLTSAARTVFDLAALLRRHELESVIEQGIDQQLFTLRDLCLMRDRLARSGRTGSAVFRQMLDSRPDDMRAIGSDYELRLVRAWQGAGLPRLERQVELQLPNGSIVHPDFLEPERRFIIEVDHATWHGGRQDNMYDRWRDRQYHLLGYHSERVSDIDINERLPQTIAELRQVYLTLAS